MLCREPPVDLVHHPRQPVALTAKRRRWVLINAVNDPVEAAH
jgi:hypothetical protein